MGPRKTRKRKAGGKLTLGDLEKQEKENLEGDSHWRTYKNKKKKSWRGLHRGTYKNKKKKSWRGTHTGGARKTREIKAGGGLTLGDLEKQEKEKLEGAYTRGTY